MAVRYRSAYRRYLLFSRLRMALTVVGGAFGLVISHYMYRNLVESGLPIGRSEIMPLLVVMALSLGVPWLIVTPFVRKPSEL
jgi:hypothetical protein